MWSSPISIEGFEKRRSTRTDHWSRRPRRSSHRSASQVRYPLDTLQSNKLLSPSSRLSFPGNHWVNAVRTGRKESERVIVRRDIDIRTLFSLSSPSAYQTFRSWRRTLEPDPFRRRLLLSCHSSTSYGGENVLRGLMQAKQISRGRSTFHFYAGLFGATSLDLHKMSRDFISSMSCGA